MRLNYNYDLHKACKVIILRELDNLKIPYTTQGFLEVKLKKTPKTNQYLQLRENLQKFGIEIIESKKELLVQKIKNTIIETIHMGDENLTYKTSVYLSEKFDFSYGYLSNVFSETAMTTIENFIILQKIELAKFLLMKEDLTLKEISHKLNYKSVAHLSNQFKKKTGITPSTFKRILIERKLRMN